MRLTAYQLCLSSFFILLCLKHNEYNVDITIIVLTFRHARVSQIEIMLCTDFIIINIERKSLRLILLHIPHCKGAQNFKIFYTFAIASQI